MPTKVPSSAQEPKLSRQANEKDHEQPQTHKQKLAKNDTQSASSMSISSPTRIDVNNGTAENIMTHLGLSADIAEGIVTNRPYRFPAELVLKGVVTKKTYNKIKEKIVATP
jgi:DNA uptake protein ComE-like DNA-binding protein